MTFERAVSLLFWPVLGVASLIWGLVLTDTFALNWPTILDTVERYDGVLGATTTAVGLVVAWMLGKRQAEAPLMAERQKNFAAALVASSRFCRELDAFEAKIRIIVYLIERTVVEIARHPTDSTTYAEDRTVHLRDIHKDFLSSLPSFGHAEREYLTSLEIAEPSLFLIAKSVVDASQDFERTRDAYQVWKSSYFPNNGMIWVPPALIRLCDFIALSSKFRAGTSKIFPDTNLHSRDSHERDLVLLATKIRTWARKVQNEMQGEHSTKIAAEPNDS